MICKFTGLVIEEFRLFWPKDEAYVSDVEPSGPFLVLTDAGKVRYARGADHLNLQKWCPTICALRAVSLSSQWSFPRFHADFLGFTSKSVLYSRYLPTTSQLELSPVHRIDLALQACQRHTCVVEPPYIYLTSEMEEPEVIAPYSK